MDSLEDREGIRTHGGRLSSASPTHPGHLTIALKVSGSPAGAFDHSATCPKWGRPLSKGASLRAWSFCERSRGRESDPPIRICGRGVGPWKATKGGGRQGESPVRRCARHAKGELDRGSAAPDGRFGHDETGPITRRFSLARRFSLHTIFWVPVKVVTLGP